MRVLLLTSAVGDFVTNANRLFGEFFKQFSKQVELSIYGRHVTKFFSRELAPIQFKDDSPPKSYKFFMREFDPDIILSHSLPLVRRWLPNDFTKAPVPKAHIEVDYYGTSKPYYDKFGFDLLIQKGYYKESALRSVWLPMSASDDLVVDSGFDYKKRKKRFVFLGSGASLAARRGTHRNYYVRQEAVKQLRRAGVLDVDYIKGDGYSSKLREYRYSLSCCCGDLENVPAKIFEFMASGCTLLCQEIPETQTKPLFGNKKVYVPYKKDCSDILEQANLMMECEESEEIAKTALEEIRSKHTHSHRIEELIQVLTRLIQGKSTLRKWGI